MFKIFIDGAEGTTGLRIFDRFKDRTDLEILKIDSELRKDEKERSRLMNLADIVFLCLPDQAAIDAVKLVTNPDTVIIDTSTAHRTDSDWTYGFCELSADIKNSLKTTKRIANPGCHATGFISIVYPLVKELGLDDNVTLSCYSITGYSGGGKKMIAAYEAEEAPKYYASPRQYGLSQQHKHLKEMKKICGLNKEPFFAPIVADFYSGMEVSVFFEPSMFPGKDFSPELIWNTLNKHYEGAKLISVNPLGQDAEQPGFLPANLLEGKDALQLYVNGNSSRVVVSAVFDNLGKGASGAAIQNMNISLGLDETLGLIL